MNDTHKMYPDKNYIYPLSSTNTSKIIYTKSKISNIHTCYKQEMIKKIEHKKHKQQQRTTKHIQHINIYR